MSSVWTQRTTILVLVLVMSLIAPQPAKGQFIDLAAIVTAIGAINAAITNVIGVGLRTISSALNAVNGVLNAIQSFFQNTIYPPDAINRARGVVGAVQGFYNAIRGLVNLSVASATLANPRQLEAVLLSRNAAHIGQVANRFTTVYQAIPPATDAPAPVRDLIDMTDEIKARETEARFQMLEKLADYDEHLMEELLSDVVPPRDEVFDGLQRDLQQGLVIPVLFGSALGDNGIRRLLKMLRHDVPDVSACVKRLGLAANNEPVVQVLKTYHTMHGGKLSLGRVLSGTIKDGATLYSNTGADTRVGGMFALRGQEQIKLAEAGPGDTVALGRLEEIGTGETLAVSKSGAKLKGKAETLTPVYGLAIAAADRKDEVKLSTAIAKLREEDPSLQFEQNAELHQMTLLGQGEMHLRVAVDRLASKYGLKLQTHRPHFPYKETIKKSTTQRGRHKRQTGGHGQFGDVVLEIRPLPRGSGFVFEDKISGGVVPRNFIPSVEKGIIDYLKEGPLGFPVVDIAVGLVDGSYHSVDSSDAAFQTAARIGMTEGMANCAPVLLEPIMHVKIHVPSDSTASLNGVISTRRGKILGFDARPGWQGWDTVEAEIPQSELHDLIVELRSLTQGVGTYEQKFHHLAELTGKLAENVVADRKSAA
jgi:elongation factor G